MGGPGSGPLVRYAGTVEDARRMDVLELHRQGALLPGRDGTITWSNDRGDVTAAIAWVATRSALVLSYHVTAPREDLSYPLEIERTPCHFGGTRPWFRCPNTHCRRRCQLLYQSGRYFLCRSCCSLTYSSRRASRNLPALASLYGVGVFENGDGLRRLYDRLARARNPRRINALRRRIARLEELALADLRALQRLIGNARE